MKYVTLLSFIVVISSVGRAQVVVTYEDYLNMSEAESRTIYTAGEETTSFDLGRPGTRNTWDFTSYTYTSTTITPAYYTREKSPFPDACPNSTYAEWFDNYSSDSYRYYRLDSDGLYLDGTVGLADTQLVVIDYKPDVTIMLFPGDIGTSWGYDGEPILIGSTYMEQVRQESVIDATGFIVLDDGEHPAVRVESKQWFTQRYGSGSNVNEFVMYSVTYSFVSKDGIVADVFVDSLSNNSGLADVLGMRYTVHNSATDIDQIPLETTFELSPPYPSPASSVATLRYSLKTAAAVTLSVHDMYGRVLRRITEGHKSTGAYTEQISTNDFGPGLYFIVMASGTSRTVHPLVVTR